MNEADRVALEVESLLRGQYHELSKNVGLYSNIIGIFFHELMIYSTNYYLIYKADRIVNEDLKFPFLNTKYVQSPYLIDFFYN